MSDKWFDLLLWVAGATLVGWGAYEIYKPLAKVAIGIAIIGLVRMARSNN